TSSLTMPNKSTLGVTGGKVGAVCCTTGVGTIASAGVGGRRLGENSGRSRVADRRSRDCTATGLPRPMPVSDRGWAFAPFPKASARAKQMHGVDTGLIARDAAAQ
ncbi:MAG: hypothetical protein ACRECP_12720, partial [Methylocella sp.]